MVYPNLQKKKKHLISPKKTLKGWGIEMTDYKQLARAERLYQDVRKDVIPIAKKINRALLKDYYPDESDFEYKDGAFHIDYMSTWGRSCSCCEPEIRTIIIPLRLIGANEAKVDNYIAFLQKKNEKGDLW